MNFFIFENVYWKEISGRLEIKLLSMPAINNTTITFLSHLHFQKVDGYRKINHELLITYARMRMQIIPTPFFIHLEAYPFACSPTPNCWILLLYFANWIKLQNPLKIRH